MGHQLCKLIGSPFADDKKQSMQSTGTFLGLTHDLDCINKTGHVRFWARDRLHDKVRDLLTTARTISRGTASKLYGLANFLEQGIYGRVGYGGLMAIKARQDETSTSVTPEIEACFEVIEAVTRFQPKREFPVISPGQPAIPCCVRCCGGSRQSRLRRFSPHLFPA